MTKVTYDRGDQVITVPVAYCLPPDHRVQRYIRVPGQSVQEYNPAFTAAHETRKQLIRDQLRELGITSEPRPGNPDVYRCGHYHLWYTGQWRIALLHPVVNRYCNHVSYANQEEALTVLLDLQKQPLLPLDFAWTLVWNQPEKGAVACHQHFKTKAEAKAYLETLFEQSLANTSLVPYQVPYRVSNPSCNATSWYIARRLVDLTLENNRTHHQFVLTHDNYHSPARPLYRKSSGS